MVAQLFFEKEQAPFLWKKMRLEEKGSSVISELTKAIEHHPSVATSREYHSCADSKKEKKMSVRA